MDIFDKISQKANETYRYTAEKTNKFTKELKLKSIVNTNKREIETLYKNIGKKVYEKHIRKDDVNLNIQDYITNECTKIDAYAKEIEEIRMELLKMNDIKQCPKCSYEIYIDFDYCPNCGANQHSNEKTDRNGDFDESKDAEIEVENEISSTESEESESDSQK